MAKNKTDITTESQPEGIQELKKVARQFSEYFNQQFKEAITYVPDTEKVASVTVSKWIEMPTDIQEAIGLPGNPMGNILMIYGKSDSGKTTYLMETIAACQRQNVLPILILTEHKFDFNRLPKYMNADPEAMIVLHASSLEEGYSFATKILTDLQNNKLTFEREDGSDVEIDVSNQDIYLMWDSVGNTLSESELDCEVKEWATQMGRHAKGIRTLTKRINFLLGKVRQRAGMLILNQAYLSMPTYGPSVETPYGGEGIPYSSALVLRFKKVGDLKATVKGQEMSIGIEMKIEVKKNHITHKRMISPMFVVATGLIKPDKATLDEYKKKYIRE